eukprot:SAG31_NODE_167_length_21485_cov_31.094922_18_plen_97_part_00
MNGVHVLIRVPGYPQVPVCTACLILNLVLLQLYLYSYVYYQVLILDSKQTSHKSKFSTLLLVLQLYFMDPGSVVRAGYETAVIAGWYSCTSTKFID